MFIEIPVRENNSRLTVDVMEKLKIFDFILLLPDSLNDLLSTSQWEEIKNLLNTSGTMGK